MVSRSTARHPEAGSPSNKKHSKARGKKRAANQVQPELCEPHRTNVESLEPRLVLTFPTLAPITDVTLLAGAPLHIALDGFDANGDTLTYTATSTNSLVTTSVPTGNRSIKMNVNGFGDMFFQLFEDLSPRTTSRIIQLSNSNFYDNTIFHRIINDFVIQGGDPTGTGGGGSQLGKFDDEFNALLQHTSTGLLSMAKSTDDTNDSQFFITEGPQRHLDFQHSIFGFLTSGESVRQAISNVPTTSTRPNSDVRINDTTVFVDTENGVLRLSAPEGASGTADITVTVNDGNGGTAQQTFRVNIVPDQNNNNPFLHAIAAVQTPANTPISFQLPATDVEGNPIYYLDRAKMVQYGTSVPTQNPNLQVSVDFNTGMVTVTPTNGLVGTFPIYVGTTGIADPTSVSAAVRSASVDFQTIQVTVGGAAPTSVDLLDAFDSGGSNSDNVTNLDNSSPTKSLQFSVAGVQAGAVVQLFSDGTLIGQANATGSTVTITTNGVAAISDGIHNITATQTIGGSASAASPALAVRFDKSNPTFTSSPVLPAAVGVGYTYDAQTSEDLVGVTYSLVQSPAGMTINAQSGLITWTPGTNQTGNHNVVVRATDVAGNAQEQAYTASVHLAPIISTPVNETIALGQSLNKNMQATDGDVGDTITWSLTGSVPAGATINPTTGAISFTPTAAQAASPITISVKATDSFGLSDTKSFQLTVQAPPTIAAIAGQQASEGTAFSLVVNATDPNSGDILTYSLEPGAPTGVTFNAATRTINWTPSETQGGSSFSITVKVVDSTGLSDTETFSVNVAEVDNAPVLGAIGPRTVDESTALQFIAQATDSDSTSLTYSLGAGAPAGASINAQTGVFTWTPTSAQAPGNFQVVVQVTDNTGMSDSESIAITVIDINEAPALGAIGAQSVSEGNVLTFTASASDPNVPHETLTYSLDGSAPAGASINPQTGQFTWTPSESQGPGNYTITIRVTDARGLSDAETVDIAVSEIDQAPAIVPVDDQFAIPGQQLEVDIEAEDLDSPQKAITYSIVSGPEGATIDAQTGLFRWTPSDNVAGTIPVTIQSTEAGGLSSAVTFNITTGLDAFGIFLSTRLNLPELIADALPAQVENFGPFSSALPQFPSALRLGATDPFRFTQAAFTGLDRLQGSTQLESDEDQRRDDNVDPATGLEPDSSSGELESSGEGIPADENIEPRLLPEASGEAILELFQDAVQNLFGQDPDELVGDWLAIAASA